LGEHHVCGLDLDHMHAKMGSGGAITAVTLAACIRACCVSVADVGRMPNIDMANSVVGNSIRVHKAN
jgi:hypothetical protein